MSMAITTLLLLLLFAASASARPCKTIFFFTSTSYNTLNPNPNPHYVTLYLTSTSNFHNPNPNRFSTPLIFDRIGQEEHGPMMFGQKGLRKTISFSDPKSRAYSSVNSSIKDRTKDIMSVVGALLFGMGCGALTAATMYLVWSLFAPNRFEFEDSDEENEEEIEDLYNPKKVGKSGYVAIPGKVVDDQEGNGDDVKLGE